MSDNNITICTISVAVLGGLALVGTVVVAVMGDPIPPVLPTIAGTALGILGGYLQQKPVVQVIK